MARVWDEKNFVGEALCLDFANTTGDAPDCPEESCKLNDPDDFINWFKFANNMGRGETGWKMAIESFSEEDKVTLLKKGKELRKAIHYAFTALAKGETPCKKAVAHIYAVLSETMESVSPLNFRVECNCWQAEIYKPEGMLYPIAASATKLLLTGDFSRIKQCGSETCDWLFFDQSKPNRRRWCDMKTCGNRAKARSFYQNKQSCEPCD